MQASEKELYLYEKQLDKEIARERKGVNTLH
jgi:hypothetical protein